MQAAIHMPLSSATSPSVAEINASTHVRIHGSVAVEACVLSKGPLKDAAAVRYTIPSIVPGVSAFGQFLKEDLARSMLSRVMVMLEGMSTGDVVAPFAATGLPCRVLWNIVPPFRLCDYVFEAEDNQVRASFTSSCHKWLHCGDTIEQIFTNLKAHSLEILGAHVAVADPVSTEQFYTPPALPVKSPAPTSTGKPQAGVQTSLVVMAGAVLIAALVIVLLS